MSNNAGLVSLRKDFCHHYVSSHAAKNYLPTPCAHVETDDQKVNYPQPHKQAHLHEALSSLWNERHAQLQHAQFK